MATTAKRVVVSELQKKVATLRFADFDVKFTYENNAGEAVSQLEVSAVKEDGSAYVNYTLTGNQTSVTFTNTPFNQELLTAIQVEVDDITKPVAS